MGHKVIWISLLMAVAILVTVPACMAQDENDDGAICYHQEDCFDLEKLKDCPEEKVCCDGLSYATDGSPKTETYDSGRCKCCEDECVTSDNGYGGGGGRSKRVVYQDAFGAFCSENSPQKLL